MMTEFEMDLLAINLKNVENDIKLKENELNFKLDEARKDKDKKDKLTTGQITLLVAIIGLSGTLITSFIQGIYEQKLERQKYESSLVLKMVEAPTKKEAIDNLKFAVDLGLIENEDLKRNILVAIADSTVVNFSQRLQNIRDSPLDTSVSLEDIQKSIEAALEKIKKSPTAIPNSP